MPPERSLGGPPRLICRCLRVASPRIVNACQNEGIADLCGIQKALRAGTGCGTCHPEIEEILAEFRGEPISRLEQMENAMVCRDETQQRVEASLYSGIAPRLPPGTEIELISVAGLRVELHLSPDDAALRDGIAERLRKLVCADLEISFG